MDAHANPVSQKNESLAWGDEYLSIRATAARLGLSPKRVRNLMSAGVFKRGYHFFRPRGIGPRFKWSRVVEWLENGPTEVAEDIPMARSRRGVAGRGNTGV